MSYRILEGDVMEMLRTLADESVQCCITSPPYWGLRDYQILPSIWTTKSEQLECAHEWKTVERSTEVGKGNWAQGMNGRGELQPGGVDAKREPIRSVAMVGFCQRCGAWRGCLGLEPTPELYVEHMVEVFREVRRVLRSDGTLWLNMGDSYANDGKWGGETGGKQSYLDDNDRKRVGREKRWTNLKPKDLVGIPWMLALALRADGWYLRQDIIWAKPNPMPESVRDRCTKAHEYLFLLTKSARYFYDQEAIKEPAAQSSLQRWNQDIENQHGSERVPGKTNGPMKAVGGRASGNKTHKTVAERSDNEEHRTVAGLLKIADTAYPMRNKRSVWTITTQPFPEAHFATFPEKLVTPCILAGTSEKGCCPKCGAPWKWIFNKQLVPTAKAAHSFVVDERDAKADAQDQGSNRQKDGHKPGWANRTETTGWQAGCECNTAGAKAQNLSEPSSARLKSCPDTKPNPYSLVLISCTVLDCFMGSGTCGVVALRYGRNFIGIELNAKYVEMARKRIENEAPLWNQ